MLSVYGKISQLGINETTTPSIARKIKVVNQICVLTAIIILLVLGVCQIIASFSIWSNIAFIFATFLVCVPILLNYLNKTIAARIFYILSGYLITIMFPIFFGKEAQFHIFMFPGLGMGLIFFSEENTQIKWWLSGMIIPAFMFVDWYTSIYPALTPIPDNFLSLIHKINISLALTLTFLMFYIFTQESRRYIKTIKDQKQELGDLNEELDSALEKAQDATKAKSQFLANMSHEIRTPMNGIIGACDLLETSELSTEQQNIVSIVSNSGNNLLGLINDILDFSKIEAGKLEMSNQPFYLRETLESVMSQFALIAQEKNLELILHIESNVPSNLSGDSMRLNQILINLIGNAVKFTESGQVYLHVKLSDNKSKEGISRVHFSIEDSGIGISQSKQATIFESFTQEDGDTTRNYGGTGLGTTISKLLVELMNGEIGIISPNPQNIINHEPGSIFFFEIELEDIKSIHHSIEEKTLDLKGIKFLIVDDNTTNLIVLEKSLEQWGANVLSVHNANECLRVIEGFKPEVLITDFHMPNTNGLELVSLLSYKQFDFSFKTIMCSSDSTISKSDATKYKVEEYLLKPVRQNRLIESIAHVLDYKLNEQAEELSNSLAERLKSTNFKILLAEDNQVNQMVAKMLFKSLNLKIDVAENGIIALDKMFEIDYDIVFMDVQMPELDGLETTKHIRQNQNELPIIALTANAMKGDMEICLEAGMNDYLSKPVKLHDLEKIIEKWLLKR